MREIQAAWFGPSSWLAFGAVCWHTICGWFTGVPQPFRRTVIVEFLNPTARDIEITLVDVIKCSILLDLYALWDAADVATSCI